ncbi:MAG: EAL domain-containing protein [Hyphomonas sp.]|uniref:EAL domain-containing protein n=1 Tax=Hyphomonas sp. TaxID=87 RepID=UPI0034A0354A
MLADGARMVPEALRLAPAAAGMISILYRHNRTFPKLIRSKRILLQRQEGTRKLSDFALDDFGAVSTSLTYLQSCGFSCVKTDRILIKRLETAPKAHGPVSVGVQMAKGLDVRVVAEGVETEQTAQVLKAAGCNELQGCYFGRPESLSNARLGAAAAETATVAA